jgi:hypothetical protein
VAVEQQVSQPAVILALFLRPARLGDFGAGGAAARRLRAAVASASSVSPLLVFVSSICDPSGRQTRFLDSDPINAPTEPPGEDDFDALLDAAAAAAAPSGGGGPPAGRRLGPARRAPRALALALAPGAPVSAPAEGVSVTLNVVVGTTALAAGVTSALKAVDGSELVAPALQALAEEQGLPYTGNFSGGLVSGSLKVISITRTRRLWQRLADYLATLSLGAIIGIAAGALAGCGLLVCLARRRLLRPRKATVAPAGGEAQEEPATSPARLAQQLARFPSSRGVASSTARSAASGGEAAFFQRAASGPPEDASASGESEEDTGDEEGELDDYHGEADREEGAGGGALPQLQRPLRRPPLEQRPRLRPPLPPGAPPGARPDSGVAHSGGEDGEGSAEESVRRGAEWEESADGDSEAAAGGEAAPAPTWARRPQQPAFRPPLPRRERAGLDAEAADEAHWQPRLNPAAASLLAQRAMQQSSAARNAARKRAALGGGAPRGPGSSLAPPAGAALSGARLREGGSSSPLRSPAGGGGAPGCAAAAA